MGEQFHLVSDLDGIRLLGNESSNEFQKLETFPEANLEVTFTAATGRTFESMIAVVNCFLQCMLDHLIKDVGGAFCYWIDGNQGNSCAYPARTVFLLNPVISKLFAPSTALHS